MNIAFFGIQGWEKPQLRRGLKGHKLVFVKEDLSKENASKGRNCDILSVFVHCNVDKDTMDLFPELKLIVTRSTGFDHIDVEHALSRNIAVCSLPSYGENTVAEHTFALILALSRKVHESHFRRMRNDFSIQGLKGFDLKGKTIGVIGAGSIGKHVIRIARGFEMNVVVYDRHPDKFLAEEMNFKYLSLNELLKKSDIITLHIPYCKETHHYINKKAFSQMKKGAILINTARRGIVDTDALIWALDKKILAGAGLDVIEGEELIKEEKELLYDSLNKKALEQLAEDHVLLSRENVVFTPHIAFCSKEALERIIEQTIEHIKNFSKSKLEKGACVFR